MADLNVPVDNPIGFQHIAPQNQCHLFNTQALRNMFLLVSEDDVKSADRYLRDLVS